MEQATRINLCSRLRLQLWSTCSFRKPNDSLAKMYRVLHHVNCLTKAPLHYPLHAHKSHRYIILSLYLRFQFIRNTT